MQSRATASRARGDAIVAIVLAFVVGLSVIAADSATRLEPAVAGVSATIDRGSTGVTADALPTVQVNGIVWTQVVVGNVVYAGGQFSTARPAGAAPGKSTVRRSNLLAFDIRTGKLITSFAPVVNGAVRALAVSPDRKTLYLGGAFTAVNSKKRLRLAAIGIEGGALRSFAPAFNGHVRAVVATASTIYVGGSFSAVGTSKRSRLASIGAADGKLRSWKPAANRDVLALTLTPDRRSIVAGGSFTKIGASSACGTSRLSLSAGTVQSWPVNTLVRMCGSGSAVMSLTSDTSRVYGSGYSYGGGNYEGVFAAEGAGRLSWLQDCRGDTYGVAVNAGRVYSVGHAHNCANIGGFPESTPRTNYRALAVSTTATGTVGTSRGGYTTFVGRPSPSLVNWFPDLTPGTFTGLSQSAWSVVASGPYVVLGGEFTAVNGVPQQGLVRMASGSIAPRKQGPRGVTATEFNPATALEPDGSVTVRWSTAWDRDDQRLTYVVLRDDVEIARRSAISRFWQRQTLSVVDTGALPGAAYRWRIRVVDSDGNSVTSSYTRLVIPPSETPSTPPSDPSPTPSSEPTLQPTGTDPAPTAPAEPVGG